MLNISQMKTFISWTKGRFFTVEFIKKDGSIRRMTCRTGVKRHSNGGISSTSHIPKYMTVYDMVNKGYRNINVDQIISLKCGNMQYTNKKLSKKLRKAS